MSSRRSGSSSRRCSASGCSGASFAQGVSRQTYLLDISYGGMEPTAVTWAVLGILALQPMSGYDIKNQVDGSIRHFWAASYGQIYPELKRLESAGWIEGSDGSRRGGGRRGGRLPPA